MPPINKLFKTKDMYGPKGQSLYISNSIQSYFQMWNRRSPQRIYPT